MGDQLIISDGRVNDHEFCIILTALAVTICGAERYTTTESNNIIVIIIICIPRTNLIVDEHAIHQSYLGMAGCNRAAVNILAEDLIAIK